MSELQQPGGISMKQSTHSALEVNAFDGIIAAGEQEELEELEQSLQALERLDRSSPDLWPDQVAIKHGSSVLSESQWGV